MVRTGNEFLAFILAIRQSNRECRLREGSKYTLIENEITVIENRANLLKTLFDERNLQLINGITVFDNKF